VEARGRLFPISNPIPVFSASKIGFDKELHMDEKIVQEILRELLSSFETLETQNMAVLQFLKDKGIASEEELADHFEQAGNASSVRWRAVRVRIDYLLSSAMKAAEQEAEKKKEAPKTTENRQEARPADTEESRTKETEESTDRAKKTGARDKSEADASAEKDDNHPAEHNSRTSQPTPEKAA
jgi:hypothetical protein